MALTPSDVEIYTLGRVSADTPGLGSVLDRAERAVLAYCNWHVYPSVTETLVLDGPGLPVLQLPSKYVTAVDEIRVLGEVLEPEAYDWASSGLVELRNPRGRFPRRYRSIHVDLVHGHTLMPPDLETVILGMTVRACASPLGETSIRVGDRSSTFGGVGTSPLADELYILDRYRVRVF